MVHCEAVPTGINWFDENKWGSHFLRWPTLLLTLWVISQGCLRRRGDDSTLAFPPHMQDMLMIDGVKPKHIFTYIHKCVCVCAFGFTIIYIYASPRRFKCLSEIQSETARKKSPQNPRNQKETFDKHPSGGITGP
jgi:hypothetical protein